MKNENGFFGRYSYTMVRLFLNQFAIGLFGAVITLALSKIGGDDESLSDTVMIVASVLATLFYMFLTYTTIWTVGAKDRISSDVGKLRAMPARGLLISLFANIPGIIIATVYAIGNFVSPGGMAQTAMRVATLFLNGMYYGLLAGAPAGAANEAKILNYWWMYFVIILPALIVTGVGYWLGTRNFHLTKMLEHQYPDSDRDIKNKKD